VYPSTAAPERPLPDFAWIHRERRRAGVTLELLHLEYLERHAQGYGYTQFCEYYRQCLGQRGLTMRQVHVAGQKTFVDYSGKRPCIWDPKTGEQIDVELFVAVLGASNFTFAEATRTQGGIDWIASHTRAVAYFGGGTEAYVCDQLRAGVTTPCRYEPGVQRTYEEWATHHGAVVLPARPGHPRDKAKVEVGVRVAQRWKLTAETEWQPTPEAAARFNQEFLGSGIPVDALATKGPDGRMLGPGEGYYATDRTSQTRVLTIHLVQGVTAFGRTYPRIHASDVDSIEPTPTGLLVRKARKRVRVPWSNVLLTEELE
jgi:transposase